MKSLSTPEKFLLLAHHPEKRRFVISHIYVKYGLAGAILLEMTLEGSVEMQDNRLVLKNMPDTDQPLLREIAGMFSARPKPLRIRYWIRRLGRLPGKYKWRVLQELERKRVVHIEARRFLGVIPYRTSHLVNRKLHNDLIHEVRKNILHSMTPTDEWAAVLGLVEACKMHRILSADRAERRIMRENLKKILKESPLAAGVDQTIRQVQAAIVASVAASSAAAATAGGH